MTHRNPPQDVNDANYVPAIEPGNAHNQTPQHPRRSGRGTRDPVTVLSSPKAPMKKVPTLPKAAPLWGPLPILSVQLVPLVLPAYSQHPVPRAVTHVPKSLMTSIIFFARDRRTLWGAGLYVYI